MTNELGTIIPNLLGLAGVGGYIYIIRVVLAPVIATLNEAAENLKEMKREVEDHEGRLIKIETVHEVKGCHKNG